MKNQIPKHHTADYPHILGLSWPPIYNSLRAGVMSLLHNKPMWNNTLIMALLMFMGPLLTPSAATDSISNTLTCEITDTLTPTEEHKPSPTAPHKPSPTAPHKSSPTGPHKSSPTGPHKSSATGPHK
eukprot:Tbor_TRINITY_DN6160_c1_g1::TRINITY_DN6160_c1_g1_i19::g.22475::m.22475